MTNPEISGGAPKPARAPATLWAIARGFLVVAAISFPGGVLDFVLRREFRAPVLTPFVLLTLAAISALVARKLGVRLPIPPWPGRVVTAVAVVLVTGVLVLRLPFKNLDGRELVSDLNLLIYPSNSNIHDCRLPPKCRDYNLTNAGLRSPHRGRPAPGAPLAAVIGDSFVFGYGVEDRETLPSALHRRLESRTPAITIGNGGIEGTSLASFPSMVRYSQRIFDPDLFVILIKRDDLEKEDLVTRRLDLISNPLTKAAHVLNLDILTEVFRQFLFLRLPYAPDTDYFVTRLDDLVAAAKGRRLLLVTDLGDGDAKTTLQMWLENHPDVGWFSAQSAPEWNTAPRIPGDGHWAPEGNELIAKILAEPIARMFESKQPVRPTSGVAGGERAPSAEQ
jgi:hypothetical protein